MATRIIRIDDIDGSDGAEAITFALDNRAYEIDLCARNRIRFQRAIEPFIERARLVDQGKVAPPPPPSVTRQSLSLSDESPISPPAEPVPQSRSSDPDLIDLIRQAQG